MGHEVLKVQAITFSRLSLSGWTMYNSGSLNFIQDCVEITAQRICSAEFAVSWFFTNMLCPEDKSTFEICKIWTRVLPYHDKQNWIKLGMTTLLYKTIKEEGNPTLEKPSIKKFLTVLFLTVLLWSCCVVITLLGTAFEGPLKDL